MSVNKVMLLGNLTRDPEIRHTSGNQAVANFGIAVNRVYTTREGERREEVTFVDCEAWTRTAEVIGKYFNKGKQIFVEGRLKLDSWTDQEGNKRNKMKVVVENFSFTGNKGDGGGGGGGGSADYGQQSSQPAYAPVNGGGGEGGGSHQPVSEDDIPF